MAFDLCINHQQKGPHCEISHTKKVRILELNTQNVHVEMHFGISPKLQLSIFWNFMHKTGSRLEFHPQKGPHFGIS